MTTTFTSKLAGLATLALAVLPAAALTTAARAETPHGQAHHGAAHVRVADLNLASAPGQAAFKQRTDRAAHAYCADRQGVSFKSACERAVRHEVQEKLALSQEGRLQLAAQLNPSPHV